MTNNLGMPKISGRSGQILVNGIDLSLTEHSIVSIPANTASAFTWASQQKEPGEFDGLVDLIQVIEHIKAKQRAMLTRNLRKKQRRYERRKSKQ